MISSTFLYIGRKLYFLPPSTALSAASHIAGRYSILSPQAAKLTTDSVIGSGSSVVSGAGSVSVCGKVPDVMSPSVVSAVISDVLSSGASVNTSEDSSGAEVNGTKELSAPEPVSPQPEASIHITSNAAISAVTRLNLLFDTFFLIYFSGNRFSFLRIFRCGSFPSAVYFCSAQQCGGRSSEIFKPFLAEK